MKLIDEKARLELRNLTRFGMCRGRATRAGSRHSRDVLFERLIWEMK